MWPAAEPDPFDRNEAIRTDPEALASAWREPGCRRIVIGRGGVAFDDAATGEDGAYFLGTHAGKPWFAVPSDRRDLPGLREQLADLDPLTATATATAAALFNWHSVHPRCPRCGEPTTVERAGWSRRCPADGSQHFPRVDPAVIVLVEDDEGRALLGRRRDWQPGWFSTLAGFVEAGETFEQAVVREVAEESGVVLNPDEVHYRGSQPWPFPSSAMIAFAATARVQEAVPDGEEIVETLWLSREEFRRRCDDEGLRVPPAVSVAHRLVTDWFGEPLPEAWSRR